MESIKAPQWSFLAVEPAVKRSIRSAPMALRAFALAPNGQQRSIAFWTIFERAETEIRVANPSAPLDRRRLATQVFYALIDLTDLKAAPDRDVQRWLDAALALKPTNPETAHAAVSIESSSSVA